MAKWEYLTVKLEQVRGEGFFVDCGLERRKFHSADKFLCRAGLGVGVALSDNGGQWLYSCCFCDVQTKD